MMNKKKERKKKTYLIILIEPDPYDEMEITAYNLTEAKRKAKRLADKMDMYVESVREVEDDK